VASHAQNVRRIRDAFNAPFDAGDAALEEVPMGRAGAHNDAGPALRILAEEAGVELKALSEYRNVSHAWAPTTRVVGASWSVHRELAGYPNKARFLNQLVRKYGGRVTVNQVRQETGRQPANYKKPSGLDALSIDEAWATWGKRMSALLDDGARLADRTEKTEGLQLGAHAGIAHLIYQRIRERQIDAEYRHLVESEL
jgi:hypothetical protein